MSAAQILAEVQRKVGYQANQPLRKRGLVRGSHGKGGKPRGSGDVCGGSGSQMFSEGRRHQNKVEICGELSNSNGGED